MRMLVIRIEEKRALETAVVKPKVWLRDIDDIFMMWNSDEQWVRQFHQYLNNQHPNKRVYTWRLERSLPWVSKWRGHDNKIPTSVFRKDVHTDHYINFDTYHYPRTLTGVVKYLKIKNQTSRILTKNWE